MRNELTIGLCALAVCNFGTLVGCDHPEIRERMQRRDASIRYVFRAAETMREQRVRSLANDLAAIEVARQRELERTPPNFDALADWWPTDARRFESRLPDYSAEIERIVTGQPEEAPEGFMPLF